MNKTRFAAIAAFLLLVTTPLLADNWNGPYGATPAAVLECKSTGHSAVACGTSDVPVVVSVPGGVTSSPAVSTSTTAPARVTVGTSAVAVFAADPAVLHRAINNSLGGQTIYWGKSASVTTSNGDMIPAGYTYNFDGYVGPVYLIVATGTETPSKVEW